MNWFKQNWTRIATVLLLAAIYYMLFFGDDSETQNKNELKFDLNITELSYALPTYTRDWIQTAVPVVLKPTGLALLSLYVANKLTI